MILNKSKKRVCLDTIRRTAEMDGVLLPLQEKAWQVLSVIAGRAPEVVSREVLIEEVWKGNDLTGDKGLNQAIWTIRVALADNARQPCYIKTVARVGYQWIHAPVRKTSPPGHDRRWSLIAAGLGALVIGSIVATHDNQGASVAIPESPAMIATDAYLQNRNIIVDMLGGCRLVVKPSGTKEFGFPVISADGKDVAFTVTHAKKCRLVTIGVENATHKEFGSCPPGII